MSVVKSSAADPDFVHRSITKIHVSNVQKENFGNPVISSYIVQIMITCYVVIFYFLGKIWTPVKSDACKEHVHFLDAGESSIWPTSV